jgi:hypothetical protein
MDAIAHIRGVSDVTAATAADQLRSSAGTGRVADVQLAKLQVPTIDFNF